MIRPIYTLTLLFFVLTTVCARNKKDDANCIGNIFPATKTDSTQLYIEEEDKTDYSKFAIQPIRVDTIWGDWEIHARQFYDGNKFTYDKETHADYAVRFNVFKGGKPVFKNYKVNSKSLMGPNHIKGFELGLFEHFEITPSSVYIGFGYCEPETDNCLERVLALNADGSVRKYETCLATVEGEIDMFVTDIFWLYTLYVNELSQATPNAASIQKVLNKYCTKGFAQKMQSHTSKNNPLLGSGKFEFQWLRSFIVHSKEAGTNSCIVHYEIPGGKKVYKRLLLQKKPRTAYDFVISDVQNATEDDLPSMQDEEEEYAEDDEI